jgi:trimethylamine--corrinoid protein Co-methyltransferase
MSSPITHANGRYVGPRRPLRILAETDVERIHEAALDVLAETGVMFHNDRALDVLEEHGASVDRETTVARIPASAVEEALATLPRGFTLGGREPEFDLPVDGEHAYLCSDGCATFVREADGTVRPSVKQDVYDAARVVEGLPNLSATSALVSAQDAPEESRVLHEFDACMRASRKHSVVVSIKDATEARPLIRMAEAVAGGPAGLSARPTFSVILCTVSPLHQERFGMELAFELAEAGIPMMLYPMPILGATAPVTPAGTAVVGAAEILAAVTAIQLACPGAKLVHAGGPTALYMRTGAYFANVPEALLLRAAQAQMARYWGLPAGLGWGGTQAKQPAAPSAYENTRGMVLAMAAGADFLFGAGLLDSVQQMSLEELVIADEVFGVVTRLLRGVAVERETLAVDLIKKMGFKGDYLFDTHTRAHVRELWQARLGETGTYDGWTSEGSPRLEDKARAVADGLLASPPPDFPADLDREFTDIIAAVETGRF